MTDPKPLNELEVQAWRENPDWRDDRKPEPSWFMLFYVGVFVLAFVAVVLLFTK